MSIGVPFITIVVSIPHHLRYHVVDDLQVDFVVVRLDNGTRRELGHFRCKQCRWEKTAITVQAARYHSHKVHHSNAPILNMYAPPPKTPEELKETTRKRQKRWHDKKKVGEWHVDD